MLSSHNVVTAAEITVTATTDDFTTNGNCTLREAIESINTGGLIDGCSNPSGTSFGTNDTIILGPGFHTLSIPQAATGATVHNASGDLNIRDDVTIRGAGPGQTIVSAKTLQSPDQERIFVHVLGSGRVVTIENMTIESGTDDGATGGMLVRNSSSSGILNLNNLVLRDASGLSGAAAVYNNGTMHMQNVALLQTRGTSAGSIRNTASGTLNMTNVTIAATTATNNSSGTAGTLYTEGIANLTNVTLFENRWGIYSAVGAVTTLSNTVMAGNEQNCRGDLTTYISAGNNWSDDLTCTSIAAFGTNATDPLLSDLTYAAAIVNPTGIVSGTIIVPPFSNSPLLAAGSSCAVTDQTGAPRAAACTIGAYEGNVPPQAALAVAPSPAAGTINGVAFLDHNANGAIGILDPPVSGITVTAYFAGGSITTVTNTAGQYTLTVPAGAATRVEFSGIPSPLTSGVYGIQTETTVQFVTSPMDNVNLALTNSATYCQDNPTLATSCYFFGNQSSGEGVLVSFPYSAGSNDRSGDSNTGSGGYDNPPHPELAVDSEIGTTWGLAYQRMTETWFAASFMKRHVGFGATDDPGTIYQISPGTPPLPLLSLTASITNPHPNATADFTLDTESWDKVGKVSLGDMDISIDDQTLYVVNLLDRSLYSIDITSATPTPYPIPTALPGAAQGCPANDVRPFAVGVNPDDGLVYVGMVCSAETSSIASDLRAYVYAFDGANFGTAPVLEFALDYERGQAYNSGQSVSGNWLPWEPNPAAVLANNVSQVEDRDDLISYPQPILADIEFDNGDMILAFMDRMGHQQGQCAPWPDGSQPSHGSCNPNGYVVNPAGELLRACPSGTDLWAIEANATCGGHQTAGANNGQGPANASGVPGEYYFMDEMTRAHREITSGGIVQIAGQPDVASIVFDPILWSNDFFAAGVHWSSNQYGTWQRSYRVFDTIEPFNLNNGIFGKSNGLGDLEAACFATPIEIGNRVWFDADGDGIQDPDEAPIAGVTVNLYDSSGNLIATAISAADGSYYFSSGPSNTGPGNTGPGNNSSNAIYGIDALDFNTQGYIVRLDNPNDYSAGGPLDGIGLTVDNNDPSADGDMRDSDGNIINAYPQLTFNAGAPGDNNHTYDFGFRPLDLMITKSAQPKTVLAGDIITYTIKYSETNGLATGAITITDQLPPQVTFLGQESATPAATLDVANPNQPVWFVPQLGHHITGEIVFTVVVDLAYAGPMHNTVIVSATGDMTSTNDIDTETTDVVNVGIDIEKATNGFDADIPTGPLVELGQPVTWSYVVTNTGSYTLTDVTVDDDLEGAVTCPSTTLPPAPDAARSMICTAVMAAATAGQYANTASVTSTATVDGIPMTVTDEDPSHYFGVEPELAVYKEPPLQALLVGDTATFQIIIENRGNVGLSNVVVTDPLAPSCNNSFATLAVGERQAYTCSFGPVSADFTNVVTATGMPPIGVPVEDDDSAEVIITTNEAFVLDIDLEKSTNGLDADQAPGPYITPGEPVTWTYVVENTGNYTLTDITLVDDAEGPIPCPTTTLLPAPGPGHSMICTAASVATNGQYENRAIVTGTTTIDGTLYRATAEDPSHYLGAEPSLTIQKEPPSQSVFIGGDANFLIVVENTGNVPLSNVVVSDPIASDCSATIGLIGPGAQHAYTCVMGPIMAAETITNVASVVGTPPHGPELTDDDSATIDPIQAPLNENPSIAIRKVAADQTIASGGNVTFTIRVTNTGTVSLSNLVVTDPQTPACNTTLANLAINEVYTYSCVATSVETDFINTIFVSGESPDGVEVSNNDVAEVHVAEPMPDSPEPSIRIIKGPESQTIAQGDSATFFITVFNAGQTGLTNVVVSDPMVPACGRAIGALNLGESVSYVCTQENVLEDFTNTASVRGDSPDGPVTDEDSAEVDTLSVPPLPEEVSSISLQKETGLYSVTVGGPAYFTITVQNTGNVDLAEIKVEDPLVPDCNIELPLLPSGRTISYTCVDSSVDVGYTNQAFVTGQPPTGPTVLDDDAVDVVVAPRVDLRLTKHSVTQFAAPGEVILYSLSVTNLGSHAAQNVVITETVSIHTVFVAALSSPNWSCPDQSQAGTKCTYTFATIEPSETDVTTFAIRINDGILPPGMGVIRNTAVVNTGSAESTVEPGLRSNETDTFEVQIATPNSLDVADEPGGPAGNILPQIYFPVVE